MHRLADIIQINKANSRTNRVVSPSLTFNPLTELVQGMHGAGLTQFDLGLCTLQRSCRTEGLFECQHHFIHLRKRQRKTKEGDRVRSYYWLVFIKDRFTLLNLLYCCTFN